MTPIMTVTAQRLPARRALRILVVLVLACVPHDGLAARADPRTAYAAGWYAVEAGDLAGAAEAWRPLAEAGDVDVGFNLGLLNESGALGVPDYRAATRWYRYGVERRLAAAAVRLARLAARGLADGITTKEVAALVRRAAEDGYPEAQLALGLAYETGKGLVRDETEAVAWYRRAAEQGSGEAAYALGRMLAQGRGANKDADQALQWYRRAAQAGVPEAQNNLGFLYERGLGVPADRDKAIAWYRRAAEGGLAVAQANLGVIYGFGQGGNQTEAVRWLRAAALQGDGQGQASLGLLYANGFGVAKDPIEAFAWFHLAAYAADEATARTATEYRRQLASSLGAPQRSAARAQALAFTRVIVAGRVMARIRALAPRTVEALGSPTLEAQRMLGLLGFYDGKVDGIAGPGTEAAVKAFQRRMRMRADGRLGPVVLATLERAIATREPPWR